MRELLVLLVRPLGETVAMIGASTAVASLLGFPSASSSASSVQGDSTKSRA